MTGAPVDVPLRVRILHRADNLVKLTPQGFLNAAGARACVVTDLASDVVRLLASGAQIPTPPAEASGSETVTVCPRHIGVLVQRNADAIAVRDALDEAGVPAVVNGAGSVLATPAARDWLRLLEALERPSAANPVQTVALTLFLGWTAEQVASATDTDWEVLHARLHRWAAVLRLRGVAALLETISRREGLAGRVLARPQGERELTDIRHIGQLLHAVVTAEQIGVTALTEWLHEAINDAEEDAGVDDRSRRLESDAEAVQVLTVHRSKGLEFPVVYCPFLWHPAWIDEHATRRCSTIRPQPIAGPSTSAATRIRRRARSNSSRSAARTSASRTSPSPAPSTKPSCGGRRRGTAATRASAGCCSSVTTPGTWRRRGPGHRRTPTPRPDSMSSRRGRRDASASSGSTAAMMQCWRPASGPTVDLAVCSFDRVLDPRWRRTSYSGITAGAHEMQGGERGRGAGGLRRGVATRCRRSPSAGQRRRGRPRVGGAPRGASAVGDDAGRSRRRHVRARRSSRRATSPRPISTPNWRPRSPPWRPGGSIDVGDDRRRS